jgi:hypothetical protein
LGLLSTGHARVGNSLSHRQTNPEAIDEQVCLMAYYIFNSAATFIHFAGI